LARKSLADAPLRLGRAGSPGEPPPGQPSVWAEPLGREGSWLACPLGAEWRAVSRTRPSPQAVERLLGLAGEERLGGAPCEFAEKGAGVRVADALEHLDGPDLAQQLGVGQRRVEGGEQLVQALADLQGRPALAGGAQGGGGL